MVVRVAEEWLSTCAGCEITVLDLGEALLDFLPKLELVHMPVLMDHKYYGQSGEKAELEIPEADIGIISGGIRTEENRQIAEEMRRKCKTIIAIGSCANFGGIPALANMYTTDQMFNRIYRETQSTDPADNPTADILPPLSERVYSVNEAISVDVGLPGCPTPPEIVAEALTCLLEGKPFSLPERSVCDDCPLKRVKKSITNLKRPLEKVEFTPGQKYEEIRCYMEQGFLCLGPVTRTGCGGEEKIPRCIKAYMPCRGCFGPIRDGAIPMIDMMGALASTGLDTKQIEDRLATFNRFIDPGRLRPPLVR